MTQGKWAELSAAQKTWSRWKAGQSLHEIGRAFGKGHSSIRFLLWHHGGIVPGAPLKLNIRLNFSVQSFPNEDSLEPS
jgi:hypothetical protein